MAGQGDLLIELKRQLGLLDDGALSALASAGLLRRARKDLESATPSWNLDGDAIKVDLGAHQVVLDRRGPAHARCTCPAKTTCQHVLAASLYLAALPIDTTTGATDAGHVAPTEPPRSLHEELMAIAMPALIAFAGKPAVREALRIATEGEQARVAAEQPIVIRLAHPAVELRYAGGGLDAFITDYRGRHRNRLIVAALIAYQIAHGAPPPVIPGESPQPLAATGAVTDEVAALRQTLIAKVARLLCETVETGLAHLSAGFVERLAALGTLAEGARLHRLALALARIADAVDLQLERNALADSGRLLEELARTYALTEALRSPTSWGRIELVGEARSAYREIASLDLFCAGAFPWRTPSGYAGLTVLFWCAAERRWLSAGESRPLGTPGFTPASSYRGPGPWAGCDSPAAIAGRTVRLANASANRLGRLSGSAATRATVSSPPTVPDFTPVAMRNWSELARRSDAANDGIGLAERNPHRDYVVLLPTRYGTKSFDPVSQEFVWPLSDVAGEVLLLRLRFSEVSALAIERLEDMSPSDIAGIVGQVEFSRAGRTVRPLTLLTGMAERRVDCIFLDAAPTKSFVETLGSRLRDAIAAAVPKDFPDRDEAQSASASERLLNALDVELLKAAERGTIAAGAELVIIEQHLEKLGNAGLSTALRAPGGSAGAENSAVRLLQVRYCSQTLRQLMIGE
jgi:hypothetical protein